MQQLDAISQIAVEVHTGSGVNSAAQQNINEESIAFSHQEDALPAIIRLFAF
jgi:hypothetical protein